MNITVKDYYWQKQFMQEQLRSIPKKNRHKFNVDLLRLIQYAQKDNYDNFDF